MPETTPAQTEEKAAIQRDDWQIAEDRRCRDLVIGHGSLDWAEIDVPSHYSAVVVFGGGSGARQRADLIVRAVNRHTALIAALKECSFRLAALVAASGDCSEANGRALDAAIAALKDVTHD